MAVKKIWTKKIKCKTYKLVYFSGDKKYVIYVQDERLLKQDEISFIPEVGVFNSKKEAEIFFEKLENSFYE